MITPEFFSNFIETYNPDYNKGIMRPLSWCCYPTIREDGYTEFSRRNKRENIREIFYGKYENNQIKIKVIYFYLNVYLDEEYDVVEFYLFGYNKNTYDSFTLTKKTVHFIADQEILTFIKQFDNYILELEDKPIYEDEYNLYIKHLKNKPELTKKHESDNCIFRLSFYFEHSYVVIRVDYKNKKYKDSQFYEYALYRNRLEGNDFNDLDIDIFFEVAHRIDEIYYDFQLFFLCQ